MRKDFIEKLYEEEVDNLFYFILKNVHDRELAEDIVQETFCIAIRRAEEIQSHPKPVGWLFMTAKYIILSENRKKKKRGTSCSFDDLEDRLSDEKSEQMLKTIEEDSVRTALKENEYMLLDLMYNQGYTSKDIAGLLGMNASTLRVKMLRIKRKLRDRGA